MASPNYGRQEGGEPKADTVQKARLAQQRRAVAAFEEQMRRRNIAVPGPLETTQDDAVVLHGDILNVVGSAPANSSEVQFTRDGDRGLRGYVDELSGHVAAPDPHTQYSLVDGTRPFTGAVGGVTPTLDPHLTTKGYVDAEVTSAIDTVMAAHESAPDPHPAYELEAQKGAVNGYAGLNAGGRVTAEVTVPHLGALAARPAAGYGLGHIYFATDAALNGRTGRLQTWTP